MANFFQVKKSSVLYLVIVCPPAEDCMSQTLLSTMCLWDHVLAIGMGTEVTCVTLGPRPKALEVHNHIYHLVK